jgi:thiol-disulfide isomerase/thioredoxin
MTGRERRRRWLGWLGQGLLVVAVVVAIQWWQSRGLVSDRAPDLLGLSLDGEPYQLDAAQGPHLVYFWASWCPVCRVQHGGIASVAGSYPVVTVATTSGGTDAVATYLAERGTPDLRVVLDDDGRIGRQWGVAGVPAVFIVGRDGQIHYAGVGYSTSLGLRLRLWLASLRDGGERVADRDPVADIGLAVLPGPAAA